MVTSLKCPVSSVPKLAVAETSEVQLCLTPVRRIPYLTAFIFSVIQSPGGGGRGNPYMKGVGMLVVSLRGVNFGFWSRLGCSGQNTIIFSRKGLF